MPRQCKTSNNHDGAQSVLSQSLYIVEQLDAQQTVSCSSVHADVAIQTGVQ